MHFIYYHMRRTTVMTVLHCFLPLLYCIGLHWSEPSLSVVSRLHNLHHWMQIVHSTHMYVYSTLAY